MGGRRTYGNLVAELGRGDSDLEGARAEAQAYRADLDWRTWYVGFSSFPFVLKASTSRPLSVKRALKTCPAWSGTHFDQRQALSQANI